MELPAVFRRVLTAFGKMSTISLAKVEMMIDMPVKTFRSVEPGPRANEHSAGEPFRAIIAIRSTVVRRDFVVSVRANRGSADTD
jgi:hypothetical protein